MHKLIKEFLSSAEQQKYLKDAIDFLAALASANAEDKGFHDEERQLLLDLQVANSQEDFLAAKQWAETQLLQAELARQVEEIGEAISAIRTNSSDSHLPHMPGFLVEQADLIIRIGDTCGKRQGLFTLGDAVVEKIMYNIGRERKHGKNS